MKLLLILLLASTVLAYKINWQCGKCDDTVLSDYCYNITGDPFINATIQLDSSISSCSQTGMGFPMNYEFSSCDSGNCNASFSRFGYSYWTCTGDEGYIDLDHVKNLTAVYKLYRGDQNATYNWCKDYIVPSSFSIGGVLVGVVVAAVVIAGAVGGFLYFKKKRAAAQSHDYQVQP